MFEVVKQVQAYINVNSFDKRKIKFYRAFLGLLWYTIPLPGFQSVIFESNIDPAAQLDDIVSLRDKYSC